VIDTIMSSLVAGFGLTHSTEGALASSAHHDDAALLSVSHLTLPSHLSLHPARMFKSGKKRSLPKTTRKKSEDETDTTNDDDDHETSSSIIRQLKASKTTASSSSRAAHSTTDDDDEPTSSSSKLSSSAPVMHSFAASAEASTKDFDSGATRLNDYETSETLDSRSQMEAKMQATLSGETNDQTGEYRGMNSYSSIIAKTQDQIRANKGTGSQGPLRANTFVRTTSRFDYQPDVCKDYKDTGSCGFGDTCIFLHDRGDYSKGWEIENEWESKQREKKEKDAKAMKGMMDNFNSGGNKPSSSASSAGDDESTIAKDDIPFACFLCRGPFTDPITTTCSHYFCEACIIASYKEDKTCPICKKDLGGVFNFPEKLMKKMKKSGCSDFAEFSDHHKG
jgi:RING finger protein 113A